MVWACSVDHPRRVLESTHLVMQIPRLNFCKFTGCTWSLQSAGCSLTKRSKRSVGKCAPVTHFAIWESYANAPQTVKMGFSNPQAHKCHKNVSVSIPKNDNLLRYAGMHLWNLIVEERPVLLQNTHYNVESWIVNVHSTLSTWAEFAQVANVGKLRCEKSIWHLLGPPKAERSRAIRNVMTKHDESHSTYIKYSRLRFGQCFIRKLQEW